MASPGLSREILAELRTLAEASPEREICGLIGRTTDGDCQIYPVTNSAPRPHEQFLLEAHAQIAAMRQMRAQDQALYAIYHSHPRGPANPSSSDKAQAAYPGVLYLIIALQTDAATEIRTYSYDGRDFTPM